jgi:NADPH:quinone reductase-like Zn-dependent oxidoreductase
VRPDGNIGATADAARQPRPPGLRPRLTQAIVYKEFGEPSEVSKPVEGDDPVAGEGQVLVRVSVTPLLFGSLLGTRRRYRAAGDTSNVPPGASRQGYEGVGAVERVGVAAERGIAVGCRVAFFPAFGAWAELVAVSAEFVTLVPDDLPGTIAAQLHVNPLTARLLFKAAPKAGVIEGGDRAVLLDAGSSFVAKLVTAIAERHSVPVVSIVRRCETIELLKKQFPRATFIAREVEGWEERVEAAAHTGGFQAGLDSVGGHVGTLVLEKLTNGGTLITYGDLSSLPLQANALSFAMRDTQIRSLVVTKWPAIPRKNAVRIWPALSTLRAPGQTFSPLQQNSCFDRWRMRCTPLNAPGRDGLVLLRPQLH